MSGIRCTGSSVPWFPLLCLLLVAVIALAGCGSAQAGLQSGSQTSTATTIRPASADLPSFPDVPDSSPYHAAIVDLAGRHIIDGYADGTFGPDDPVTREQFAKMIVLAAGYPVSEADICPFTDVAASSGGELFPDHYVAVAAERGITRGTSATTFSPGDTISRFQVISMAVRCEDELHPGLLAGPLASYSDGWHLDLDYFDNSPWNDDPTHSPNARRAAGNGLLSGLDYYDLDPWGAMTRGEVAQTLYRLIHPFQMALWGMPGTPASVPTIELEVAGEFWTLPAAVALRTQADADIVLAGAVQQVATVNALVGPRVAGWPTTRTLPPTAPGEEATYEAHLRVAGITALTLAGLLGQQADLEQAWVDYEQRLAGTAPDENWGPPSEISSRVQGWKVTAQALTQAIAERFPPETTATSTTTSTTTPDSTTASAMYRANPARTGVYPGGGPTEIPELLWTFQTNTTSIPAVLDGVLYVGDVDGFYALDASSGEPKWKADVGAVVDSSPAVAEGTVYFGAEDGCLHALDITSGQERWKFQTGANLLSFPAVVDGVVYITDSYGGYLHALDAATGEEKWNFERDDSISGPVVSSGVVYVGCYDAGLSHGAAYALDAVTGEEKWTYEQSGAGGPVAIADGVVYGLDDGLYALDAATGEERWTSALTGQLAVFDGTVYVCVATGNRYEGGQGYLHALDAKTGEEKWVFETDPELLYVSAPSVSGGLVYFSAGDGPSRVGGTHRTLLYALDTAGREQWVYEVDKDFCYAPTIAEGVLYVVTYHMPPSGSTTTSGTQTRAEPGAPEMYVYALK